MNGHVITSTILLLFLYFFIKEIQIINVYWFCFSLCMKLLIYIKCSGNTVHVSYVVCKREGRADVISGSPLSFVGCHCEERYTVLPKVLGRPPLTNRFDYFSNFYEYKF